MLKIVIMNYKGGSGKTTTALSLSAGLARRGKKVRLIDADPQGNATKCSGFPNAGAFKRTLVDALQTGDRVPCYPVHNTYHVVPSTVSLARAESIMSKVDKPSEHLLKCLFPWEKYYDYCVIDCSPAICRLNAAFLNVSDYVIIPLQAEPLALDGLITLIRYIRAVQNTNANIKILGILICRFKNRLLYDNIIDRIDKMAPGLLFCTQIRDTIKVPESQICMHDIYFYDNSCSAAVDYSNFVDEVIIRIQDDEKAK